MEKLSNKRIKHMHGVAEYMYENAEKYGLNADKMYILGLLHDIGYIVDNNEHEVMGARLLNESGYEHGDIISWHGTTPSDYMRLRDCESVPKELILLWEADMSIDSQGMEVSFVERLFDIRVRYGKDSIQYRKAKETVAWLQNNIRRYTNEE